MTVSTTSNRISYSGNGATLGFAFPYLFLANSDLVVFLVNTATGVSTTQIITTNYTVTGAGVGSGGTVTMLVAPPAGFTLTIYRDPDLLQSTDLQPNDPFPADTLERMADKNTLQAQRLKELVNRSLRQPDSDAADIATIPNKVSRAGYVLAFDATTGDPKASNLTLAALEAQPTNAAASAAAAAASATSASTSAGTASTASTAAIAAQAAAESAAAGMKWRPSVRVATTTNIVLSGTQTIDGIAVVALDRVLVKDQSTASQNGVYVCAAGAWTRATDADTWTELVSQCVAVEVGTVNADYTFICTVDQGGTIGVTSVTWSTFKITQADGSIATVKLTDAAKFLLRDASNTTTVGYKFTPFDNGTKTTGTFTPDAANHNYQYYTNNGAHTLAAPAADSAIDILVTNGASAGAITFSGFTVASGNTGDALTTTNASKFIISIRRINSVATYAIKALQ